MIGVMGKLFVDLLRNNAVIVSLFFRCLVENRGLKPIIPCVP